MEKYINQNRKMRILGMGIFVIGLISILFLEKFIISRPFSIDRAGIMAVCSTFLALNFFVDTKLLWEKIYKFRYVIGFILFAIIVVRGYHISSIGVYADVIQPGVEVADSRPFWNQYLPIRSDEFLVTSPSISSQYFNDFQTINNKLMARETNVQLFPNIANFSITVLGTPQNIGFLFLNFEMAYSFYWFLPIFMMFFGVFELCMIMTDKKIYSLLGAMLVTFSPAVLWWTTFNIIAAGIMAMLMFSKFLNAKTWKTKLIFSMLFGWAGVFYIFAMYPAWQVPFGYVFLGIMVWLVHKNLDKTKWLDVVYIVPVICVILVIFVPALFAGIENYEIVTNTVYPGKRVSGMGANSGFLFGYLDAIFFPLGGFINPCEAGQFVSLYPLPIFVGLYLAVKNFRAKTNDFLLNTLLTISVFLSFFSYVNIPLLNKITMMTMSTTVRLTLVTTFSCTFLLVYILAKYRKELMPSKKVHLLAIIGAVAFYAFAYYSLIHDNIFAIYHQEYLGLFHGAITLLSAGFYIILAYVFLINNKKMNIIALVFLMSCSLFQAIAIHPITKGLSVLNEKPFAKEIQTITEDDEDAKWIVLNSSIYTQSYVIANGAKLYNSTHFFPNMDFWHTIDPNKTAEDVYNRYAHVGISLTDEETSIELGAPDVVIVNMNISELKLLEVDYVASNSADLETHSTDEILLEKIYSEENCSIYKVEYK